MDVLTYEQIQKMKAALNRQGCHFRRYIVQLAYSQAACELLMSLKFQGPFYPGGVYRYGVYNFELKQVEVLTWPSLTSLT